MRSLSTARPEGPSFFDESGKATLVPYHFYQLDLKPKIVKKRNLGCCCTFGFSRSLREPSLIKTLRCSIGQNILEKYLGMPGLAKLAPRGIWASSRNSSATVLGNDKRDYKPLSRFSYIINLRL